tara:strand:+ start:11708 stop:11875 length:168 start_codon:yes stop_codon:yes gene_type:complete
MTSVIDRSGLAGIEYSSWMNAIKPREIDVSAVHDIDESQFETDFGQPVQIGHIFS